MKGRPGAPHRLCLQLHSRRHAMLHMARNIKGQPIRGRDRPRWTTPEGKAGPLLEGGGEEIWLTITSKTTLPLLHGRQPARSRLEGRLVLLPLPFFGRSRCRSYSATVYEKIRCRWLKKHNLKIEKKILFSFFKRTSNGHI